MNKYDVTRKNVMTLTPEQQESSGLQQDIYLHGKFLVQNWLRGINQLNNTLRFYNEYEPNITDEYKEDLLGRIDQLDNRTSIMTEAIHQKIETEAQMLFE